MSDVNMRLELCAWSALAEDYHEYLTRILKWARDNYAAIAKKRNPLL